MLTCAEAQAVKSAALRNLPVVGGGIQLLLLLLLLALYVHYAPQLGLQPPQARC